MPSTAGETFYDLAVRALEEQERQVTSLRVRTGTLVAAAAVAATLLAREVFADTHPDGIAEWSVTVFGLVGLGVVLIASVFLLRSHDLAFSLDVREAYDDAEERQEPDGETEVHNLHLALALSISDRQADNQPTVSSMRTAFAWALAGLLAEIVGLGTGAALA